MQLLKLRYYQQRRDLGYWVPIIAALVFFACLFLSGVSDRHTWVLATLILLIFYTWHQNRKDLSFIFKYLDKPRQQLMLSYSLLLLPVSLAYLYNQRWQPALALHLLVPLLAVSRFRFSGPTFLFPGRIIPMAQFEWISGLRKNFYLVILLLIPAIILSPVKLFGVAALFLLNTVFLGFYGNYEPRHMLNPYDSPLKVFLHRKVTFAVKALLLLNLPLLIVNSLFHPGVALFNLAFLAAFVLLTACMVFLKYANYIPNQNMAFTADLLVLFAAVFLPYLLPLGIYLYFNIRKKALINLSQYLDDHS